MERTSSIATGENYRVWQVLCQSKKDHGRYSIQEIIVNELIGRVYYLQQLFRYLYLAFLPSGSLQRLS